MLNTIETKFVVCPLGRNGKLSRDLNLPYIRACILEVMRLRTTVPLSIPRSATCDAVVNGYHIPKGTEVCKKSFNSVYVITFKTKVLRRRLLYKNKNRNFKSF